MHTSHTCHTHTPHTHTHTNTVHTDLTYIPAHTPLHTSHTLPHTPVTHTLLTHPSHTHLHPHSSQTPALTPHTHLAHPSHVATRTSHTSHTHRHALSPSRPRSPGKPGRRGRRELSPPRPGPGQLALGAAAARRCCRGEAGASLLVSVPPRGKRLRERRPRLSVAPGSPSRPASRRGRGVAGGPSPLRGDPGDTGVRGAGRSPQTEAAGSLPGTAPRAARAWPRSSR